MKISITKEQIIPDILKYIKPEYHKFYNTETNKRTIYHVKINGVDSNTVAFARNLIFKHQYRLPCKALIAGNNHYIAQKSLLSDKSSDISTASKIIEPLNIGFDEYIRLIPINQKLPVGTIFTINVHVPYESMERKAFMSNKIKPIEPLKETPFDPCIHIGVLDIGSEYVGKFTVDYVDQSIYDSYTLFTFAVNDDDKGNAIGFDIITYDFMHVSLKWIIEECLKLIQTEKSKSGLNGVQDFTTSPVGIDVEKQHEKLMTESIEILKKIIEQC